MGTQLRRWERFSTSVHAAPAIGTGLQVGGERGSAQRSSVDENGAGFPVMEPGGAARRELVGAAGELRGGELVGAAREPNGTIVEGRRAG